MDDHRLHAQRVKGLRHGHTPGSAATIFGQGACPSIDALEDVHIVRTTSARDAHLPISELATLGRESNVRSVAKPKTW
jgi:hypothetical protein